MKLIGAVLFFESVLFANPTGHTVVRGEVSFQEDLRITATDRSEIHWDTFSIGVGEKTEFILPDSASLVLNRVISQECSTIHGRLASNGRVILINPNGVLFGRESRIDVAHLMASTTDIHDNLFKNRPDEYGPGKIEVGGWIGAQEIALCANEVELGEGCYLSVSGDNGGGSIAICGKIVQMHPQARVEADALLRGDGGSILFWGAEKTHHRGTTTSRGGPLGGKGGFVEISGKYLDFSGTVQVPNGSLLLDPVDVTIQAGGGAAVCGTNSPAVNTIFDNIALGLLLDTCSVTIQTSGGATGLGDITVLDPVTWSMGANTFTLTADRHIFVYNFISATGAGISPINLTANTGNIAIDAATAGIPVAVQTINGAISVSAPLGSISIIGGTNPGNFAAVGRSGLVNSNGNINVVAGTDLFILGGSGAQAIAHIGRAGITPVLLVRTITGNIDICVRNTLQIYAGSGARADAFIGHGSVTKFIPCVTATSNFNINVGHDLDMMSGSTTGASFIGSGASIDIIGDMRINVGEYMYLHNHPTNNPDPTYPKSTFIGYIFPGFTFCSSSASDHQNLYLNVGKNLTFDSRNLANTGGEVFIHLENSICDLMVSQGIQKIHVGGDINLIAGTRKAVIDGLAAPCPLNEVLVEGSIRCYNGDNTNAPAFVISDPTNAFGNLGLLTIRACGNIIQAGGIDFTSNLSSSFPIFFEADATFAIGELWPPLSCVINGSNIFTGTPLSVNSGNASTVDPFNVGGNGLGGFAIETSLYNCNPILFPSSITGYFPILSPTTPPCPPIAPANDSVTYSGNDDITLLSSDRFVDATPADHGIGFQPDDIMFFTSPGDITIAGFRNINIHEGPQSAIAGSILIIAQNDIAVGPNVGGPNALSAADNLTLVVDNQAPIRPLIGGVWRGVGGLITVDAAAELISGTNGNSGYLRIYTARQSLNSILGRLNGQFFSPGTLFVDTLLERWCMYYPEPFNGLPFTIFYKECLQQVALQATLIVSEILENLHPYDEFPGWAAITWLIGRVEELEIAEPYILRRRHLNLFNHPQSWSRLTGGRWAPLTSFDRYHKVGVWAN